MKAYRITIQLQEVNPLMWREVIIPATATFKNLHEVIQKVSNFKGWTLDEAGRLFEFNLPEENLRITNDAEAYLEHRIYKENREEVEKSHGDSSEEFQAFNESRIKDLETVIKKPEEVHLGFYLEKHRSLEYVFDYEDKWQFIVGYVETVEDYPNTCPTLINGAESAPIENLGGAEGYNGFLKVYNDPEHPEHKSLKEWSEKQGYEKYDPELINGRLKEIKI